MTINTGGHPPICIIKHLYGIYEPDIMQIRIDKTHYRKLSN